jgi:hypothetical protein
VDQRAELLKRVREDVQAISSLTSGRMNVPIEDYIDKTSLNALCDSLNLEPEAWRVEDLEKILIIRDGLYTLRNQLRDDGDEGEHSVEQLLSTMDRLYADLERAMRALNSAEVQKAQQEIAALQRTPQVDAHLVMGRLSSLSDEAGELLTRTHITYQRFEVNLIKINRLDVNVEVLRNAKLVVQRLSATVFAIKLSLEQNVIYQGVFRFLSEGADKIVDDLRRLAERFQKSYKQADDFISDLSALVEKGHRFTKHVAEFLRDIFGDAPIEQKQLKLKARTAVGMETMLCAARIADSKVLLAGKDGYVSVLDATLGKIVDRHQISDSTINCLARATSAIVAGSDEGLGTINLHTLVSLETDTIFTEKIAAVAAPHWGVVSGTRDGILRRWNIDQGILQRYGSDNLRAGKSVQRMLVHDERVLVAAGDNLLFVDESLEIVRKLPIDFFINDMCLLSHATLILCGHGKLAHVNLSKGIYTRFVFASEEAKYTCVAAIDENTFCAGTDEGNPGAIDLQSNSEIGNAKLSFPIRGMLKMPVQSCCVRRKLAWQFQKYDCRAYVGGNLAQIKRDHFQIVEGDCRAPAVTVASQNHPNPVL